MSIVVNLSNKLRNAGIDVSIRSTMTAHYIMENYQSSFTQNELYNALKSIYVKDVDDYEKFDKIFEELFGLKIQKLKEHQHNQSNQAGNNSNMPSQVNMNQDNISPEEIEDTILEREERKVHDRKIMDNSMVLLDQYDHRIFEICKKLSRKIANKRSMRQKSKNSSQVNMPLTIRSNMKYGGHFVKLITKKPHLKKSKHIFLCDVSGSCEWISSWFFALLYGCQKTFHKIQLYDFDNKLIDMTDTLTDTEYKTFNDIAIAHKKRGALIYGQSDMTKSFSEFYENVDLNNNTDVIILTDCRDWNGEIHNGQLKSASILSKISKRAHRVIIINPEKKIRWNTPTSCVKDFENAGADVYEAATLEQLEQVISKL